MGDITLKFILKNSSNNLIDEDLSSYLKFHTKNNQYNGIYENNSMYKFIIPAKEKFSPFYIRIEHEDYESVICNTAACNKSYTNIVCNFIKKTDIPTIYAYKYSEKYSIIELNAYHLTSNKKRLFNDNYERHFYKANSLVELEVKLRDDKVADDDQIQWGIVSWNDLCSIEKKT